MREKQTQFTATYTNQKPDLRIMIKELPNYLNQLVTLKGWVQAQRDHGKLIFFDLRDRSGLVQCVLSEKQEKLKPEAVLLIKGMVKARDKHLINKKHLLGNLEIEVKECQVLSKVGQLPIGIDGDGYDINEEVRLKYRYLDLRRQRMQNNLRSRSKMIDAFRQFLFEQEFVEIETPLLTKSTKEGARDFLVPSRFQKGKFYALPQSPQQYKQLLMVAGFERYFQVARCIRDEDLRADRGFEFTQLDLEMSFVTQNDVMSLVENMVKTVVKTMAGRLKADNFPVYTYEQAIAQFGADRFDLRSEKDKVDGILAFAWVVDFPFFKKVDKSDQAEVRDGKSGWTFTHNPFSTPQPQCIADHLAQTNIENILTAQYDLVCNGFEVGGGSIRAHQPEILKATMKIMGYSDFEIEKSIGHMLVALSTGAPPHGGIALGLDRLAMLLNNEKALKEVIAFPMTASGRTAVMDAPSVVSDEQLAELSLTVGDQFQSVYQQILQVLLSAGCEYRHLVHKPLVSSQEFATTLKVKIDQVVKSLVLEIDKEYVIYALPGACRAELTMVAKKLGAKKVSMVSKDSVRAKLGLEVGAVPPFGFPFAVRLLVDHRVKDERELIFSAGRSDRSLQMETEQYLQLANPWIII